jgi:hypothetical protein
MEGVQDLLSLVVDVLNRVAKELPDRTLDFLDDPATPSVLISPLDEEPPIADLNADEERTPEPEEDPAEQ